MHIYVSVGMSYESAQSLQVYIGSALDNLKRSSGAVYSDGFF